MWKSVCCRTVPSFLMVPRSSNDTPHDDLTLSGKYLRGMSPKGQPVWWSLASIPADLSCPVTAHGIFAHKNLHSRPPCSPNGITDCSALPGLFQKILRKKTGFFLVFFLWENFAFFWWIFHVWSIGWLNRLNLLILATKKKNESIV